MPGAAPALLTSPVAPEPCLPALARGTAGPPSRELTPRSAPGPAGPAPAVVASAGRGCSARAPRPIARPLGKPHGRRERSTAPIGFSALFQKAYVCSTVEPADGWLTPR